MSLVTRAVVAAKLSASAALKASGALPENVNCAIKSSYLLSFLESVPEMSAKLKEPNTEEWKFEDVVKDAEQAAVLVLVYWRGVAAARQSAAILYAVSGGLPMRRYAGEIVLKAATKLAFTPFAGILSRSMSTLSQDDIKNALKAVKYPGYSRDIVSFGLVKQIATEAGAVSVTMQLTSANADAARQIKAESERVLKALPGVTLVHVEVAQPAPAPGAPGTAGPSPWANQNRVPGIRRILAVASGKGGVGKSTVAVNLACALQHLGERVGLLDCDIYGPSIPLMMGTHERPTISANEKMVPPVSHGVKLMSIGFLVSDDQPVIWRGPMIQKTIQQFIGSVEWGELDFLLVDLPPGTGDAQLSLCQTVPLDGGVIVTTPQEASLGVVRKGIAMFEKVNVPITGIVENMSYFTTPNGERVEIFGHGGGRAEAERQKLPFLGEIPIFTEIREGGDQGRPVVVSAPDEPAARSFVRVAEAVREAMP